MADVKDYGDGHNRWTSGPGRGGRFAPKSADARGVVGAGGAPGARGRGRPSKPPRTSTAGTAPAKTAVTLPRNLPTVTVKTLTDAFRRISAHPPGTPGVDEALLALDAELARREGTHGLAVTDTPHSRQVDDLVTSGWGYLDAYAEVHHLDVEKLRKEERLQLVEAERRPGERRTTTIRRMYADMVGQAALQAEDDTRGNLLSRAGRAAAVDPATLWSGTSARARKYASDELKQWWSEHGGRRTITEFTAQFTGDRAAAERARGAGQGRDYGI